MILQVVSVRDSAADTFERPFFVPALGLAVRAFGDEIGSADSLMSKHPSDYALFHIGTFDTDSGVLESIRPSQLSRGADFILASS